MGAVSSVGMSGSRAYVTCTITELLPERIKAGGSGSGTGTDAWGSFNGVDTIDGSFNVASITKTNTGRYTVVFTIPMPTAGYSVVGTVWNILANTDYTFVVQDKRVGGFDYVT